MAYQVLARKWRPKNFKEMVGQEHVLRALINALDENRLHHAYLFTGTRGVGKTTIARIISKSLNCETGVGSNPCGVCSTCTEIDEGRFVDLIEVDAASRTKVEDTRELLENVQYAPTRGRYKVYLIDEVHMLSTSSFNALLKTLEEPPPHVKFLLATTDPQKLPATVLSRCLQFSLKRMPLEQIVAHHQFILGEEGIAFDDVALKHIARAADGSMRDSLSLLDQSIAFGHGQVRTDDVVAMLGFISKDHVQRILQGLAQQDAQDLMAAVSQLAESSPDYTAVIDEMLSVLHQMALAKQLPEALDDSLMDKQSLLALAELFSPEDIQLYYQIALSGKRDLPLVPEPRNGLEMLLLRMLAFKPAGHSGGGGARITEVKREVMPAPVAPSVTAPAPVVEEKIAEKSVPWDATADTVAAPTPQEAPVAPVVASEPVPPPAEPAASAGSIQAEIAAARAALGVPGVKKSRAARRQELAMQSPAPVSPVATPAAPPVQQAVAPENSMVAQGPQAEEAVLDYDPAMSDYEQYAMATEEPLYEPEVPASDATKPAAEVKLAANAPVQAIETPAPETTAVLESSLPSESWGELLSRLSLSALAMQLAQNCSLKYKQSNHLELVLSPSYAQLNTVANKERLQEALTVYFGTPQTINIEAGRTEAVAETPAQKTNRQTNERQQYAVDAIMNDPNIQQLQQLFGARVKQEAIKLIETKPETV